MASFLRRGMLLPRNSKASASCRPQQRSHKPLIHNMLWIIPASGNRPVVPDWGGTSSPRAPKKGAAERGQRTIGVPPLHTCRAEVRNPRNGQLLARTPRLCPAIGSGHLQPRAAVGYCTELVADPTMISPVVVNTPGRQPKIVQPPPVRVCSTTWIMLTVMPLDVTPSPLTFCSFRIAYPMPGRSTRVLGATSVVTGVPFTTRFTKPEPSASLAAPVAST